MEIDKEKWDKVFAGKEEGSVVGILIHPSPDPDALGSAVGVGVLLHEVYKLNSKIFHFGEISHPQNKSFKNVLHIQLSDGRDFNSDDVCATVLLDTDFEGSGFKSEKLEQVDVRIDHHLMDRGNGAKYKDVRTVGSTCSMIWEYLRHFNISLEGYSNEATAMVIGIKTDTIDFTSQNTSELDMEAYRSILPFVDKTKLSKVTNYQLPKVMFDTEVKAYKNKDMRSTVLFSFVGELAPANRDIIPTIADRFMRMDGVNTTVVVGIIEDHLVTSVRSDDDRVDVNDLCINTFGKSNAGGKEGSGGARIGLGPAYSLINDKETKDKVKEQVINQFKEKIFETLGAHKEEEA